jgi:hypothetical protein
LIFDSCDTKSRQHRDGTKEDQALPGTVHKVSIETIQNFHGIWTPPPFGRGGIKGFLEYPVIGALTTKGILGGDIIDAVTVIQKITEG